MKIIEVFSVSGGTGATTTACAVALSAVELEQRTLIVDARRTKNITAVLGMTDLLDNECRSVDGNDRLYVANSYSADDALEKFDVVVVDAEGTLPYLVVKDTDVTRIGVVRNDYISLKNQVNSNQTPDAYVCTYSEENVLTINDVRSVLSSRLGTIKVNRDSNIQRAMDAGLFKMRFENLADYDQLREFVGQIISEFATAE